MWYWLAKIGLDKHMIICSFRIQGYIGTTLGYSYTKLDVVPIEINVTNNVHKIYIMLNQCSYDGKYRYIFAL